MLSVQTNLSSMVAQSSVNRNNNLMANAMERLSTGLRINHASDDAAGLQIADRMNANVTGMKTAQRNISDAMSMLQTADGALDELSKIANRQKELATQAANGVNTDEDKTAMTKEFNDLSKESRRILSSTTFAGNNLFDKLGMKVSNSKSIANEVDKITKNTAAELGQKLADATPKAANDYTNLTDTAKTAATGDPKALAEATAAHAAADKVKAGTALSADEQKAFDKFKSAADKNIASIKTEIEHKATENVDSESQKDFGKADNKGTKFQIGAQNDNSDQLDVKFDANIDLSSLTSVTEIGATQIDAVDTFAAAIDTARSQLGANVNRLEHTTSNLTNVIEKTKAASGRIMDADFADESARMTKEQLLVQAGTKVLGRANQNTGLVMGLLG